MSRTNQNKGAGDSTQSELYRWLAIVFLLLAVVASALGVVYAKHQSRRLFAELQALKAERDDMAVEWDRLQLEQSTFATHGRIERIAREQLQMRMPNEDQIIYVRP